LYIVLTHKQEQYKDNSNFTKDKLAFPIEAATPHKESLAMVAEGKKISTFPKVQVLGNHHQE
jgi:hypothetical protein